MATTGGTDVRWTDTPAAAPPSRGSLGATARVTAVRTLVEHVAANRAAEGLHLINEMAERYDLPGTYAAILFVVLVSVLFFAALERAERWLTPSG